MRCSATYFSLRRPFSVRRQLLFPVSDNYTSLSTTTTLWAELRREAPPERKGEARARSGRVGLREGDSCGGKVGNLLLVFHFSIRPRRRSCGNVGISPAFGEISKGLVVRVESRGLAFQAFHSPVISTAFRVPFSHAERSSIMLRLGFPPAGSSRLPRPDSS